MNEVDRDVAAFARTVEALGPYLDDLVFIGGWAHYLYTLTPDAAPLGFTPLTTEDADVAAPLRLRVRGKTIPELLIAAGFEQRLSGDHIPPVSEYALGDEESGFYVEFLAPLEGGEVKRGGRVDVTTKVGGKIHKEPTDIPTVGRFAVLADPQGASISVFKPSSAMAPHDPSKEGEFSWNELVTSDSVAAFKFYSELFGWKILEEMDMGPMGKYRIFGIGEQRLGGMMTAPKGAPMPPIWLYYATTNDLDAALERATKKGAKVMNGPMDVPGGGRIVQLMDPQGAAFALHQGPRGT